MSAWRGWARGQAAIIVAAISALAVGCVVQSSTSSSGSTGSGGGSSGGAGDIGGGGGSTQPMLVDVDPDRTLTARPGDGVGVFTEYRSGGHWHLWWTCDTNKTALSCSFDVTVSVGSGAISNAAIQVSESSDRLLQSSSQVVEALTQTSTGLGGITIDTDANAIITVDAKMNGQESGSFLFFVQGGQVNGGYQGTLTDPLMLQPGR